MRVTQILLITITFAAQIAAASPVVSLWQDKSGIKSGDACKPFTQSAQNVFAQQVAEIVDTPETVFGELRGHSVLGTFWQSVQESSGLAALNCQGVEYLVYDVHGSFGFMRVAARPDAALFRYAKYHSPEEAEIAIRPSAPSATGSLIDGLSAFEGGQEFVLCGSGAQIELLNDQLNQLQASVANHQAVKLVQSWSGNKKQKQNSVYIQVQTADQKMGWVEESAVKHRSACAGVEKDFVSAADPTESAAAAVWNFPTIKRTSENYKEGMRRFKAARANGRLHAACDLYRVKGETAQAVTDGTVVRSLYYFYEGTYALEVKHTTGKIVRYGEVTGTVASGTSTNKKVTQGQTVGYIGKVNSGCCTPMLHFEMYAGTATGPLTQSGNKFQRRKDLMDPSAYLTEWEKAKFGVAY